MSKDVIIAGSLAVGCIALIAVAFLAPKNKPTVDSESTKTETTTTLTDTGLGGTNGFDSGLPNGGMGGGPGGFNLPPANPPGGLPPSGFGQNPGGNLPPGGNQAPPFGHLPGPDVTHVELTPPPSTETKTHTVAAGEYLGDIAMKYYGSAKAWKKIQDANPGVDQKNLKVGQKLVIPAVDLKPTTDTGTVVTPGAGERTYMIKKDDSLYVIAKRELGSASRWKEIEKLNNISSGDLKIGQVIKLPASAPSAVPDSGSSPTPPATGSKTHTVAKGETLGDISKIYFGTSRNWKKIEAANPGVTSDNLKIGQKLIIPEIAGTTPDAPSSSPATGAEYTVKKGDTLGSIALSELGAKSRAKEIQDANPGVDSKSLRIGQKLKIPGKSPGAGSALPPAPTPSPIPSSSPSPFGAPPQSSPFNPAPTGKSAIPPASLPKTDNNFNSPYGNNGANGGGFGQPVQPFGQPTSSFGQTGTSTLPSSDPFGVPAQPTSSFTPAPPAPSAQPLR